jgi:hypothetical protein
MKRFSVENLIFDNLGWVVLGVFSLMVIMFVANYVSYKNFMTECTQDHKAYECDTMWATSHQTPVILTR